MALIVAVKVIFSGQAPLASAGSALTVTLETSMGPAEGRAVGLALTGLGDADASDDGTADSARDGTTAAPEPAGWPAPAEAQPAATTETAATTMATRRLSMFLPHRRSAGFGVALWTAGPARCYPGVCKRTPVRARAPAAGSATSRPSRLG